MVKSCAAYNCTTKWRKGCCDISFHRFPINNLALNKKWIAATKRKNFVPGKYTSLCSRHFTSEDFIEPYPKSVIRRLKEDAVPTIFQFSNNIKKPYSKKRKVIHSDKSLEIQECKRTPSPERDQNVDQCFERTTSLKENIKKEIQECKRTPSPERDQNVDQCIERTTSLKENIKQEIQECKRMPSPERDQNVDQCFERTTSLKENIKQEIPECKRTHSPGRDQNMHQCLEGTMPLQETIKKNIQKLLSSSPLELVVTTLGSPEQHSLEIKECKRIPSPEIDQHMHHFLEGPMPSQENITHVKQCRATLQPSTKVILRRKVKVLQQRLRRRENKIKSMKNLISVLKNQLRAQVNDKSGKEVKINFKTSF